MIIGIDASRANREHKSGTEWYSYYLLKHLARLDSKNKYILYTDKPLTDGLLDLGSDQESGREVTFDKAGFQIIKSPHNNFKAKILKWPFNFLWTQGRLSLEMIFNAPDVLFVPAHTVPFIHPRQTVVTIHDIGFTREDKLYSTDALGPENMFWRRVVNKFVKLITNNKYEANKYDYLKWSTEFALKQARRVITVSEFTKKEILEVYPASTAKISVVHNGYPSELYKRIDLENPEEKLKVKMVCEKYGLKTPYIFYLGRLEKKKNTVALIEAFSIMRSEHKGLKHKLVLIGDASFGYDQIKYAIEDFRLDGEVVMPGWIDERDMPYIFSGADAFIFPSLYEGFGIPILESFNCGVPVAASNIASIPEIAGDAALFFNPLDTKDMANVMKQILTDDNLRGELIKNGLKRCQDFSWDKCAAETLEQLKIKN